MTSGPARPDSESAAASLADQVLWRAASGLLVINVLLLAILWLMPMPDSASVPGRAPRVVVGS